MTTLRSRNTKIGKAALFAALTSSFAMAAFAQDAAPAATEEKKDEKEAVKLEKFEVTGSRIKRADIDTPSPVVQITRASLEETGFTNLGDALRAMPMNSADSITPEGSSNGFAAGTSTINLRGLGNNNTLILINGRRAVPSGSGAYNGFQSVVDVNQLPTSAVESLEIVKDGASAIYGSDAVAGVVNVKLRKDFAGLAADVSVGNTFGTDSLQKSAFAIFGAHSGKTSITVTADALYSNAILNKDLSFSRTADNRLPDRKGTTSYYTINDEGTKYTGIDWRSSSSYPARFYIPGTNTLRTFAAPTTDPLAANAVAVSRATGAGYYDYQQVAWMTPEVESRGMTMFAKHEFSENLYAFLDTSFRRLDYHIEAAGSPFTTTDKGVGTNNRLLVSKNNPYNPYGTKYFGADGVDIELSTFRLVNAGTRKTDATSDYPRLVAGLGGKMGESTWTWEGYYMYSQGSYANNSSVSYDSLIQKALLGVNINGKMMYANPFGTEDAAVTDYYSGINPNKATFTSEMGNVNVSGELAQLPAGPLSLAAGAEYRTEEILDVKTADNETGNIVGGSEGFGYEGTRTVASGYAELSAPIVKGVELQTAVRFEDYSDFGSTTKPKIAMKYRATDWLIFRGSFSKAFKAPDLAFLMSKGSVGFTGSQLLDPRRPDLDATQIKTVGRGNPNLKPEETDTYYGGMVVDLHKGALKGLTFEAAYFRFDQKNLITRDAADFTLEYELDLPAGRVIRQELTAAEKAAGITVGRLDYIANDWYNSNKLITDGVDMSLSYEMPNTRFGRFRFGAEAVRTLSYEREDINSIGEVGTNEYVGTTGLPKWKGNVSVAWRKGDWSASTYVYYTGKVSNGDWPDLNPHVTVNPQVSYAGLWDTKITVGLRNALNNKPPFDLSASGDGYAGGMYSPEPIFWYMRLSREF